MIGRHVARYTPRFWTFGALPATFGQSSYESLMTKGVSLRLEIFSQPLTAAIGEIRVGYLPFF